MQITGQDGQLYSKVYGQKLYPGRVKTKYDLNYDFFTIILII